MKHKRIELGGRVFRLAPLTFGQVEELLDQEVPQRDRAWLPLLQSLANAGAPATVEDLETVLDLEDFRTLQGAVLELSALRRDKKDEAEAPRENNEPLDFPYVRARLAAHCGWTSVQSDGQPFSEISRLLEYWAEVPPVDPLFASFVGYKPPRKSTRIEGDGGADKVSLVQQWGGRIIKGRDNMPSFLQAMFQNEGLIDFSKPRPQPNSDAQQSTTD